MSEYLGGPFVYSTGGGLTCSICAPDCVSAENIEVFAYRQLGATEDGNRWRVFDKSQLEFLQPTAATPQLCNHAPSSSSLVLNRRDDGGAVGDRRGAL